MSHNYSARELIREHKQILDSLRNATILSNKYELEIRLAVENLQDKDVNALLSEIPVDELNREKLGIRTGLLREHGFDSVADVVTKNAEQLSRIPGVGMASALTITRIAKEIRDVAKRNVAVKLNRDDVRPETTQLVKALSRYRRAEHAIEEAKRLLSVYEKDITKSVEIVSRTAGWLKSLFASREAKAVSAEAHTHLKDFLEGSYGLDTRRVLTEIEKTRFFSDRDAWQDFTEHTASFYSLLERIRQELLGGQNVIAGLPEELATKMQEVVLSTEGLKCDLRRYQEWGVRYILTQGRVLLGDEMGLGKTVQALASIVSLRNAGATHFLVVCPASVISNWCREITSKTDLPAYKIHLGERKQNLQLWLQTGGIAVTNYENAGHVKLDVDFQFDLLVVDEAHYIKNPKAKRTEQVKRISNHASRVLFMTGTALENKAAEMVELIQMLQPKIASEIRGMTFLASAPEFRAKIAPVYYRRRREDVLTELPELLETKEWCELSEEETKAYEEAVRSRNYTAIRRVSWAMPDLSMSSKAARMIEIIEEAREDDRKVIVFSFYLETIHRIAELLGERCSGVIHGAIPPGMRQEIIDRFHSDPAGNVLVAQIQSGGTGLNIQAASVVVLCEPQFKPSTENQAISRAYRMGQSRNVLVHRLLADDTVDERITELLEGKQEIFDAFADESVSGSAGLAEAKKEGEIGAFVASQTPQPLEEAPAESKPTAITESSFHKIVEMEAKRIAEKYGISSDDSADSNA